MNNYSFDQNMSIGKRGEETVLQYYKNNGVKVRDVRNVWSYRNKDIDFFFNGQAVEVKTQQHIERDKKITLEITSNTDLRHFKIGWLLASQAEVFVFFCPSSKTMYQILAKELRQFLDNHREEYPSRRYYNIENNGITKESVLRDIPLSDLEREVSSFRKITIE